MLVSWVKFIDRIFSGVNIHHKLEEIKGWDETHDPKRVSSLSWIFELIKSGKLKIWFDWDGAR